MTQVTQLHHRKINCIVSRTIPVESALSRVQLHAIQTQLKVSLHVDRSSDLMARYDASQIRFNQIWRLPTLGVVVSTSRWFRIKAAWHTFSIPISPTKPTIAQSLVAIVFREFSDRLK